MIRWRPLRNTVAATINDQVSPETAKAWDKTEALVRVAEIYGYVEAKPEEQAASEAAKVGRQFNFTL